MVWELVLFSMLSLSAHAKGVAENNLGTTVGLLHLPLRKTNIAVEGVIYCKSCKLPNYDKSMDASPLPGVVVKLWCSSGKYSKSMNGVTNPMGYFLILVPKVPDSAISKCKVYTTSVLLCNKPVYPKDAMAGIPIKRERSEKLGAITYDLYTSGFTLFAPSMRNVCPRVP